MSIIAFIIAVLIVAGLLIWAVRSTPIPTPWTWIIQVLIAVLAAWVIASKAGLT